MNTCLFIEEVEALALISIELLMELPRDRSSFAAKSASGQPPAKRSRHNDLLFSSKERNVHPKSSLLLAIPQPLICAGLRAQLFANGFAGEIIEAATLEDLHSCLLSPTLTGIVLHQDFFSAVSKFLSYPFILFANCFEKSLLIEVYQHKMCYGYITMLAPVKYLIFIFSILTEQNQPKPFWLDPYIGTAIIGGLKIDYIRSNVLKKLTSREREVIDLLQQGFGDKAIAERLCITGGTVRTHIVNISRKAGITYQQVKYSVLLPALLDRTE